MRLEWVDNCIAWGEVIGRDPQFPKLLEFDCEGDRHANPRPGWLVTCYSGLLDCMQKRGLNRPGLGVVVAVVPHPKPRGSVKWMCLVLWNWDKRSDLD